MVMNEYEKIISLLEKISKLLGEINEKIKIEKPGKVGEELTTIQRMIVSIGKKQGYVRTDDVGLITKGVRRQMNRLVALGYFKEAEDKKVFMEWEYMK